ncbi:MAG TPA: WG repeat-containing protein, partial [Spirochaetota bacterium]|nr:WG repeat-containing protein [Spirochaetota bacterium]
MNRFFYFVFLSFVTVFFGCMSDAGNNIQKKNENFASVLFNEEDKKSSLSLLDKLQKNKDLSEDAYREKILENLEKEKNKKENRLSLKIKENLENILKKKNFEKKDKENIINILEEYKKYLKEGDNIFLKIKYDNKLGYINSFGDILIPPVLEGTEIGNYNSKYVWVKSPPKFFIMDNDFNTTCSSEKLNYDDIYNFSEGIALVRKNSKYGYIDKNGKVIVNPVYEDGTNFNSNVAFVKEDNLWGMINKTGNFIIKPYYDWVWGSQNDYYAVKKNNYYGIVNKNGKVVVEIKYDWVEIIKEKNNAILSLEGKKGCVDLKNGKTLINFDYEDILYINEAERFIIKKDALYYICDEDGKTLGNRYDNIYNDYYFSDYFYFTKNYNYGIIDKNDELILKEDKYAFLKVISKDKKLIAVRKFDEDYCRIIDFSGKEIAFTRYSSIDKFINGFFRSEKNGKYGLIDDNYNEVLPTVYENILKLEKSGCYRISKNKLYGIADDKGKIIVEPKYEMFSSSIV